MYVFSLSIFGVSRSIRMFHVAPFASTVFYDCNNDGGALVVECARVSSRGKCEGAGKNEMGKSAKQVWVSGQVID